MMSPQVKDSTKIKKNILTQNAEALKYIHTHHTPHTRNSVPLEPNYIILSARKGNSCLVKK